MNVCVSVCVCACVLVNMWVCVCVGGWVLVNGVSDEQLGKIGAGDTFSQKKHKNVRADKEATKKTDFRSPPEWPNVGFTR